MKLRSLIISLSLITLLFSSCDKQNLSESEKEAVKSLLTYEWYDLKFTSLGEDAVINDSRLVFSKKGNDLNYVWEVGYNAIFGSNSFHDEGKVELSYSSKQKGIIIELFNKENKPLGEAVIEIEKDSIIPQLKKQVQYRDYLEKFLNQRKVESVSYNREIRGIFKSVINEGQEVDNYEELENFTPVVIKGLSSNFKTIINWEMKEKYTPNQNNIQVKFEELNDDFSTLDVSSIKNLLKGPLKYFDSNIKSEKKFTSTEYSLEIDPEVSYNSNTNKYEMNVVNQNLDFLLNAPAKLESCTLVCSANPNEEAYATTSIFLNVDGMIKYANGGQSVSYKFKVMKDNKNPNRIYLFDDFKYYVLEK